MTQVTRRKHVFNELLKEDNNLPKDHQQIVRIVACRGNNLHEVASPNEHTANFLVTMPIKFRKSIWIKRGDYVLVEPIEEGNKVKAEICKILTPDDIKEYIEAGVWPEKFDSIYNEQLNGYRDKSDKSSDDYLLLPNTNRVVIYGDNDDEATTDSEQYADSEEECSEEEDETSNATP